MLFERAMHALVATILLGMAGLDSFRNDAETKPAYLEMRQSAKRFRREGKAVIGPNPIGEAELAEGALELLLDGGKSRFSEAFALDEITRVAV